MQKTTMENLIYQLEQEIKKYKLGGIKYYGLMQAKSMAESLIDDEEKELKEVFNEGVGNHQSWSHDKWFFHKYKDTAE
jgi:hypothetical protein